MTASHVSDWITQLCSAVGESCLNTLLVLAGQSAAFKSVLINMQELVLQRV